MDKVHKKSELKLRSNFVSWATFWEYQVSLGDFLLSCFEKEWKLPSWLIFDLWGFYSCHSAQLHQHIRVNASLNLDPRPISSFRKKSETPLSKFLGFRGKYPSEKYKSHFNQWNCFFKSQEIAKRQHFLTALLLLYLQLFSYLAS